METVERTLFNACRYCSSNHNGIPEWGNWKNWREYHASMFFICAGGLLYEYIVKEKVLSLNKK
jgi:hypothetical protein